MKFQNSGLIQINQILDHHLHEGQTLKLEVVNNLSLSSSKFKSCRYENVVFSNCHFFACDFDKISFDNCVFENCTFEFSHFRNSFFDNCNFNHCTWKCSSSLYSLYQNCELPLDLERICLSGKSEIQKSNNLFFLNMDSNFAVAV